MTYLMHALREEETDRAQNNSVLSRMMFDTPRRDTASGSPTTDPVAIAVKMRT